MEKSSRKILVQDQKKEETRNVANISANFDIYRRNLLETKMPSLILLQIDT